MALRFLKKGVRIAGRISPRYVKSYIQRLSRKLESLDSDLYMLRYAFPWAIEKVKERYSAYHTITDNSKPEVKKDKLQ